MLRKWSLGQVLILVFALATTCTSFTDTGNMYEIKFQPDKRIFMVVEECLDVENGWLHDSSVLDTEGNCLELWSEFDCNGNVLYYVSSGDDGIANVSWGDFRPKSVKLCEPRKQPTHRVVRRGLAENSTEYYFWAFLSKMRGRSDVFLEEFRKGGGHPDWEKILGGRNWQGPRSKLYMKALYKVVNVFKTYCDMDMKWSRYTTRELAQVKQLAADVVRLRQVKALKFPHADPQSKVHAKIVDIWKNITITLDRAYDLKTKYDLNVKLAKSSNESSPATVFGVTLSTPATTTVNEQREFTTDERTTRVDVTSTSAKQTSVSKEDEDPSSDESVVRIID